jgi:hypothetical protein
MDELDYLFKQHKNIVDWYKQAEAKSKFLHAINGLVAGIVNWLVFKGDKAAPIQGIYKGWLLFLLYLVAICVIGSYGFMLQAVWARHHEDKKLKLADDQKLWFFGHLAKMDHGEFKNLLDPFDPKKIVASMLSQNQILSKNVKTKFDALNNAITLTTAALILIFLVGLLYASGQT